MRFFLSLFALFIWGCGGGAVAPLTGNSGSLQANQSATAKTQIDSALGGIQFQSAPTVPTVGGSSLGTTELQTATNFDNCQSITPATRTDADSDGIADYKKYVFDCNNVTSNDGTTNNISGTIVIDDLDDSVKYMLGGYSIEYEISGGHSSSNGSSEGFAYSGFQKAQSNGSNQISYSSNFQSTTTNNSSSYGQTQLVWQSTWNHTITAEDPDNFFNKGTMTMRGFFKIAGMPSGSSSNLTALDVVFELSSQNLVYNSTCGGFYESGSVTFTDGSGNRIVYTYNCTATPSVTFNGQAVQ